MHYRELVTDGRMFVMLRDQCDAIFHTDRRLPEYVFQRAFSKYYVFEHEQIMSKEFEILLTALATDSEDLNVNYMTVDPDPEKYYHKHCDFYGIASFDSNTLIDNYLKVMRREGNVESFGARGGDVGVLWGTSMKWGIFCDRISWELCLLGSDVALSETTVRTLEPMDAVNLVKYISGLYQNNLDIGQTFMGELGKNYPELR